jgi:hypothetical protein
MSDRGFRVNAIFRQSLRTSLPYNNFLSTETNLVDTVQNRHINLKVARRSATSQENSHCYQLGRPTSLYAYVFHG